MHAMVRTAILIVVGQLRSDQWDVMNLDGRIMSQQTSGGVCMAAKFGRAKFHEFTNVGARSFLEGFISIFSMAFDE